MTVVATIDATHVDSLVTVSGWAHDAHLLSAAPDLAVHDGQVSIEFQQEPLDNELDLPRREFVRRSWWATEYRLPFVRCRLMVASARSIVVPNGDLLGDDTLLGVSWNAKKSRVDVDTGWGPIAVNVGALNVRLEITDEVVSVRRRRVGRLLSFDATAGPAST